jgi:hypothetical protein
MHCQQPIECRLNGLSPVTEKVKNGQKKCKTNSLLHCGFEGSCVLKSLFQLIGQLDVGDFNIRNVHTVSIDRLVQILRKTLKII